MNQAHAIVSKSPLSQFECPNCQEQGKVWGESFGKPIIRCSHCDLHYLEKDTRPATVVDNGWCRELVEGPVEWAQDFLNQMGRSYRLQLSKLETLSPEKSVLDFGAGPGVFLAAAKRDGWNALGVEASPYAREFGSSRYGLKYVETLGPVAAASFGAVRMSHVLEHIPEPLPLLAEVKSVLKPHGVLNIIVPNREPLIFNLLNRTRRIFSEYPRISGAIYPDIHVLGFSIPSLRKMLVHAGFTAIEVRSVSMGDTMYYPWLYDGFLNRTPIAKVFSSRSSFQTNAIAALDRLGNPFGLGTWLVAYCKND